MHRRSAWLFAAALIALVLATYAAGLPGAFLLDDFPNLKTLQRLDGPLTWAKLGSFVFSNESGDLGRILPMLSFAAQHASWPGDPAAFKFVNVALHALNALLVFWLVLRLSGLARRGRDGANVWVAAWVSAAWAMHPLLVSTVLYTVQRMAIMSATFMFIGLVVYLAGRRRMADGDRSGIWMMTAGVIGGTLLATACKENGVLLPLVVLVVEFSILGHLPRGKGWIAWVSGIVLLPLVVLFGYIGYRFDSWILPGYSLREFDLADRLLTQSRVLSDYLGQIALPKPAALGLFHDDYVLSHSLVEPWTTLPAIILVIGMIAGALSLRRRTPALSMGVLWYFGAQILESGPIPLEIYFEHRNYFPMAGLLIGVGIEAVGALERVAVLRRHARYGVFFAASWLVMLSGITYAEARLWAEPYAQAGAWAKARPDSMRAQAHWAGLLADMRFTEGAEDVYDSLTPRDPGYRLTAIATNCLRSGTRFREGYDDVLARMRTMKFSRTVIGALERLAGAAEAGRCLEASRLFFEPTVAALLDNAHFTSRRFHLRVLEGRYRIAIGRYRDARQDFLAALSLRKDVEVAMLVVKASYLAGDQAQAGVDLDQARRINAGIGVASWTYGQDIEDWAAGVAAMPSARQTGETDDAGDVCRGADARRGGPAQGEDGDAAR